MQLTCPNETFKLEDIPTLHINNLYGKSQWKPDQNVYNSNYPIKTIIMKCNISFFFMRYPVHWRNMT